MQPDPNAQRRPTGPEKALFWRPEEAVRAALLCFDNKFMVPGLILVFSAMDAVAALEGTGGVKANFVKWVGMYFPDVGLPKCQPIDLYGARCGVVHQLGTDSDLFAKKEARRVVYAWGTGTAAKLRETLDTLAGGKFANDIALHTNDLVASFRTALTKYESDLAADAPRRKGVEQKTLVWAADVAPAEVDTYLSIGNR